MLPRRQKDRIDDEERRSTWGRTIQAQNHRLPGHARARAPFHDASTQSPVRRDVISGEYRADDDVADGYYAPRPSRYIAARLRD